jgi:hypothetical protein
MLETQLAVSSHEFNGMFRECDAVPPHSKLWLAEARGMKSNPPEVLTLGAEVS